MIHTHDNKDSIRMQINIEGAGDLTGSDISGISLFAKENNEKILIASYREQQEQFWYDPDEPIKPQLCVEGNKISCIMNDWDNFKSYTFWAEITYNNKNIVITSPVNYYGT